MSEDQDQPAELKEYGIIVRRRPALVMEGFAVGALFIVTPILFSLAGLLGSGSGWQYYGDWAYNIVYALLFAAQAALLLFILWTSGDDFSSFGLGRLNWRRDLRMFLLCLITVCVLYFGAEWLFRPKESEEWRLVSQMYAPVGWLATSTAVLEIFAAASFEEMLHRGYMIPRLNELWNSRLAALLVSAVLFGAGHLYQGSMGAFLATIFGLITGALFLWRYSIWPLMLAHSAFNLIYLFGFMWKA